MSSQWGGNVFLKKWVFGAQRCPCQQMERAPGGGAWSHQVPPPVDINAIAGGLGPQSPILLHEVVHGLFDALVPIFLLLGMPGTWRQQLRLCFYLPHGGQRGVTPALWLFTLEAKGRGYVRDQSRAVRPEGLVGHHGVRGVGLRDGARSARHREGTWDQGAGGCLSQG